MFKFHRRYSVFIFWIILTFCGHSYVFTQDLVILPNGHSHNDYTRNRPLYDALDYGFTSIEVDVYWHEGRMVVTHDDKNLEEKQIIEELYLDPLRKIVKENNGKVYKDQDVQLVLMVDLKSEKVDTYLALKDIFSDYLDVIERFEYGKQIDGPIRVLLSGGPPIKLIEKDKDRFCFVDGSVEQWSMDYPVELMPRASTNYRSFFKWYGKEEMPKEEEKKLRSLIKEAHDAGRKVRFWGCPNRQEVWQKLLDEGADWINVDDLEGFNKFYQEYTSQR